MDTRKLITILSFLFFTTPLLAQENSNPANPIVLCKNALQIEKNVEGNAVLKWNGYNQMAKEFLLQASTDGNSFRAIKRIVATSNNAYETVDESGKGYNYYRIICIDGADNYLYSKAVPVK